MILIADSGSTKCTWSLNSEEQEFRREETSGINPFYQTPDDISEVLTKELFPKTGDLKVDEVYFYSAGCIYPEKIAIVKEVLNRLLASPKVEVCTDLLAAARSACGEESGISCILGTGSNSCLYDGEKIIQNVSPLGFILGDEGSGACIGKLFIGNLLKNQYSSGLYDLFMQEYRTTPSEIMENVYRKPFPNRYLAQFAKFIANHIDEPTLYQLVFRSLSSFIRRNIKQYDYKNYPVYFVGSVAWYFSDILNDACIEQGFLPACIQQSPIEGLIEFHKNKR